MTQEKLPYLMSEGSSDQGEGLKADAYEKCRSGSKDASRNCRNWRDEKSLGDGETSYESEFESRGVWVVVVGEVVSEEDAIARIDTC